MGARFRLQKSVKLRKESGLPILGAHLHTHVRPTNSVPFNRLSKQIVHNGKTLILRPSNKADIMHRNLSIAMLATVAVAGFIPTAFAGSSDSYANTVPVQQPTVTTFTAAAPPVLETYVQPTVAAPIPLVTETVKDGFYDENRYGGNAQFGYEQRHACGGAITGEKCLVILSDHMRRVRLERPTRCSSLLGPSVQPTSSSSTSKAMNWSLTRSLFVNHAQSGLSSTMVALPKTISAHRIANVR